MLNVIRAEWIKLRSTKALWWTSALIIFFAAAIALLMGGTTASTMKAGQESGDPMALMGQMNMLRPGVALTGLTAFGTMIVLIQSVMSVTSEYAHGTQKTSMLATPKRWQQPVAKVLVYGVIAVIVSFIAAVLAILGMEMTFANSYGDSPILDLVGFSAAYVWSYIGRTLLYTFLCVMLAVGTAYLVRHTAGAIALLLLWKLVIENAVIPLLPKIRDVLPPWMPFTNMDNYTMRMPTPDAPWAESLGQTGSVLYFAFWAVVVFVAGVVVMTRRDA